MNSGIKRFFIAAGIIAFILLLIAIIVLPPYFAHRYRKHSEKFENIANNDGNMTFAFLNKANNSKSIKDYAQIDNHKTNYISGHRILTRNGYGHYNYINT